MTLVILVDGIKAFLGVAQDGRYLKTKEMRLESGKRPDLLKEISGLVNIADIEGVVVFSGPGAFTSLRVAVAIANALSFSLDIPIVGIPEIDDPKKLLGAGLEALVAEPRQPVVPFYKKPPNITQPKKK